ncbi:MAG: hypothetical protein IKE53_02500 [Clostridiales bacterium]|nr:hypothetical protein [Clostridiales bacterium]
MVNSYILKHEYYKYDEWEKVYTKYLEMLYESSQDLEMLYDPYNDPDAMATMNAGFYNDLASFLNTQEKRVLNGKWEYKAIFGDKAENYGIQVYENKEILFVLFSDQFGFSAPDRKHPYDYYVKLAKAISEDRYKEVISNVVEWVFNTRSIGGSFLWPRQVQEYNLKRGGSEKRSSYIQDRVDLTLLEIKHFYDEHNNKPDEHKNKTDILYPFWDKEDLKLFFEHFGSFDTYIKFFMMEDFVDGGMPIDIITGERLTDNDVKRYIDRKDTIFTPEIDKVERMLSNVNSLIVARTNKMQP